MKKSFALIGPGRVGQAVARLLIDAGYDMVALVSRDAERARKAADFVGCPNAATTDTEKAAEADIVLLAVADDFIATVAAELTRYDLKPGTLLVHFSGFHRADVLLPELEQDLLAVALHPLQTFANAEVGVRNLPGSPCSVEGTPQSIEEGKQLVHAVGGVPFRIGSEQKTLYHAAACVLSNNLVANARAACEIFAACGFDRQQAFELLKPLLAGTCNNLESLGPDRALTGPISRGDVHTVRAHLEALAPLPADLQQIYRVLGRKAAQIGHERGSLDGETVEEMLQLLKADKKML